MIKERQVMERIQDVAYYYYKKTGDRWYLDLAHIIDEKLDRKKWWRDDED